MVQAPKDDPKIIQGIKKMTQDLSVNFQKSKNIIKNHQKSSKSAINILKIFDDILDILKSAGPLRSNFEVTKTNFPK